MTQFKVALLQMTACDNNQAANQAKGERFCRQARMMGADLALFPEMWNVGYTPAVKWDPEFDLWRAPEQWTDLAKAAAPAQNCEVWQGQAIGRDDPFITHFQALARELEMAIALTYLSRTGWLNSGPAPTRIWWAWRWPTMPGQGWAIL